MDILTVKEVADYLSCSISTIRSLVRKGEIPYFRIGTKLNFNKEAIDNWVYNQEIYNMTEQEVRIKKLNIRR